MTWTSAADAVVPACAHACPPTAVSRQRGPGCASPRRRLHLLRADLAAPGWPSDPPKGHSLRSSIVIRDEDSSRDLWSPPQIACAPPRLPTVAVHGPGSPVASPRSHGMPCRGFCAGRACARLVLTDDSTVPCCTDISEEVKRRSFPDLKDRVPTPRLG
jgi:hypothetical protein